MFIKFNFQSSRIWFILAFIALVSLYSHLLFADLGDHAFIDWDEGIYAQVSKETFESSAKAYLTFFGQPWFEKPPLLFWLTSVGFSLFGIGEFGARFFVALAAVFTMIIAGYSALLLFKSRLAAFLTLASFFFFPQVYASAFFLNTDTLLSLWVSLAVLGFALVRQDQRWWLLFFLAGGLAILTKGIAGLYPFIIAVTVLLWNRDWRSWRSPYVVWGVAVLACLVVPWHLVQSYAYGQDFWNNYFLYHFVDRYTTAIEQNGAPFRYFFDQLLLYPGLALLTVWSVVYVSIRSASHQNYRIPLVAVIVIFLIVSSSKTKLLGYAIPLYPFLAICIGSMLAYALRLLKSAYLIFPLAAIIATTFVYFGFQMNAYKIAKAQANLSYEQSKQMGKIISELPDFQKPIIVGPYEYSGLPALWYYSGKKLQQLPRDSIEPDVTVAKQLFHTYSKSLYEFKDYYYVHIEVYNP